MELFRRLSVTRSQLAAFLEDSKTIKLFEDLFSVFRSVSERVEKNTLTVDTVSTDKTNVTLDFNAAAGGDFLIAVDADNPITSVFVNFPIGDRVDGQRCSIASNNTLSNLQWFPAIDTFIGTPTTITPETPVTFAYVEELDTWYRVV